MAKGNEDIDVSIIIPVYNVESYIAECLTSVMQQTASCKMECVVVDDRGTDKSMIIARELIENYSGPIDFNIVVREKNGGLSAARNSGINVAKGKYIYLLDSDDLITADCIAVLMERAKVHPRAQIVCGDFQTFPQRDVHKYISLQGKNFPDFSDNQQWIRSVFLSKFPITSWNKLIKREFITTNGLYFREGILHEDNHWQAQAYHSVKAIAVVNKVTYLYRLREGSITMNPESVRKKLANLELIYQEMFSKEVAWDKPWAQWIRQSLLDLKFSYQKSNDKEIAISIFKSLTKSLAKNRKAPLAMRLIFRYWGFRHHRGQERTVRFLFCHYWGEWS